MALMDILVLRLGAAAMKAVAKTWLQNDLRTAVATETIDIIKARFGDVLVQRSTLRILEQMQDDVGLRLKEFTNTNFPQLAENEKISAAISVAELVDATNIASTAVAANLDATVLEQSVLAEHPLAFRDLPELTEAYARRLLNETCNYVISIASHLPEAHANATKELLIRTSEIHSSLLKVLDGLQDIQRLGRSQEQSSASSDFEAQYRRTVVQQLDRIELFGIRVTGSGVRSVGLTDAYVPVMAVGTSSPEPKAIEHLLSTSRRYVIRGEAGLGKTTFMQWLAVSISRRQMPEILADWRSRIPFYIRPRDYVDGSLSFPAPENFMIGLFRHLPGIMPVGWVHEQLNKGAIILVDGLDEVPARRRVAMLEWLTLLTSAFENTIFVVSSRPAALDADRPIQIGGTLKRLGFSQITLERFTLSDSLSLVSRWHNSVARDMSDQNVLGQLHVYERKLQQAIRNKTAIRNLVSNPLLCAMICAVNWDRQEQLPSDRMELYRIALDMLLEAREVTRGIEPIHIQHMVKEAKERVLDEIAYWMLRNESSEADERLVVGVIKDLSPRLNLGMEPETILAELLERSGIIRRPQHDVIDFIHRTLQEYLGARAAVAARDFGLLALNAKRENWREAIVFAAGHASGKDRDMLVGMLLRPAVFFRKPPIQVQITAVCCLETVSKFISEHEARELHACAARLFPPKHFDQARLLAPAAELSPALLEGHQNSGAQEVAACIRCASYVGTDAMLNVIEAYASVPGQLVEREIVNGWLSFDWDLYERVIIDKRDIFFGVTISSLSPELATCLKLLLPFFNPHASREVVLRALRRFDQEHTLSFANPNLSESNRNSSFKALGTLSAREVARITQLTSLEALEVESVDPEAIAIFANAKSLKKLALSLQERVDLSPLVAISSLESLSLSGPGVFDVSTLRNCRQLKVVRLRDCPNLTEVGSLLSSLCLEELYIARTADIEIPVSNTFSSLKVLSLNNLEVRNLHELTKASCLQDLQLTGLRGFNRIPLGEISSLKIIRYSSDLSHLFRDFAFSQDGELYTADIAGFLYDDVGNPVGKRILSVARLEPEEI